MDHPALTAKSMMFESIPDVTATIRVPIFDPDNAKDEIKYTMRSGGREGILESL